MSLQILERQQDIVSWIGGPGALETTQKGCKTWTDFLAAHKDDPNVFHPDRQDDSGI